MSKINKASIEQFKIYILHSRQILFRKSHGADIKMTKVSCSFESLVDHVIVLGFYHHVAKCDGRLSGKLFHPLRWFKAVRRFLFRFKYARGWESRSSGSRSASIHWRLFELVEECRGPQRRQPSNEGSRELELLRSPSCRTGEIRSYLMTHFIEAHSESNCIVSENCYNERKLLLSKIINIHG